MKQKRVTKTNEIREADSRGKHTTTHRKLFVLDNGLLIDTPGLREIQLWEMSLCYKKTFADIDSLSASCKFVDCKHESEPGCKIKEAIANGEISEERFANYEKMKRELEYLESRVDRSAMLQKKQKERKFHKTFKEVLKQKYDNR
ncbi:MAG: ribosome small subunit-dependent GTPase A [Leptospiraceae bacterium]|nr:ribosome small subunit-dependent GTPase A [Leptospiraceae bacterium]